MTLPLCWPMEGVAKIGPKSTQQGREEEGNEESQGHSEGCKASATPPLSAEKRHWVPALSLHCSGIKAGAGLFWGGCPSLSAYVYSPGQELTQQGRTEEGSEKEEGRGEGCQAGALPLANARIQHQMQTMSPLCRNEARCWAASRVPDDHPAPKLTQQGREEQGDEEEEGHGEGCEAGARPPANARIQHQMQTISPLCRNEARCWAVSRVPDDHPAPKLTQQGREEQGDEEEEGHGEGCQAGAPPPRECRKLTR